MARQPKPATSFYAYALNALLQKMQFILQCLTGNADYPSPAPDLKTFSNAIDVYAATLVNTPSKVNTANKKVARTNLIVLANQLALYVTVTANGDAVKILESGFSLTKTPQRIGILPKPDGFKAVPLHTGSIKLSLKKIVGADSYCFEYASADVKEGYVWTSVLSTKANTIISNLNSGSQYVFRVTGIGSNPTCVYSNEVTSFIL